MTEMFFILLDDDAVLPERWKIIENSWGDVPVNHAGDYEFNNGGEVQLSLRKWEFNRAWSGLDRALLPHVMLECLIGKGALSFLKDRGCPDPLGKRKRVLSLCYREDSRLISLDTTILRMMAKYLANFGQPYLHDGQSRRIDSPDFFSDLPSHWELFDTLRAGPSSLIRRVV